MVSKNRQNRPRTARTKRSDTTNANANCFRLWPHESSCVNAGHVIGLENYQSVAKKTKKHLLVNFDLILYG